MYGDTPELGFGTHLFEECPLEYTLECPRNKYVDWTGLR